MSERDRFLKALAENEDDTAVRLVFADWLDEHGEHEEADRQRRWPAAKEWLTNFCDKHNPPGAEYTKVPYEELIGRGLKAFKDLENSGGYDRAGIGFGDNERMCDALRENRREFWKNWSLVTGIVLPTGAQEKICFSCSC